ncbi:U2-type spliceosomal complex subunit CWC25 LALA0_S11e02850g [Lachancea lanzarotensis]|uniref:Pre-mRNA-splicing factor CWC25 n=1 Tax=Lachancea lanzarotensis TaxID=1245769 RepID=A0A0C7NDH8_9SACH|nr:uncharacterized protein LALA0_S11e02850g [Lachancea lanzarotensis]CEP64384.1 LALA0S11e02850g1_1 [Lachancea lanzarotensis]
MGTGDLNLLKSWNPHLLKNKKKVWETEQQLLEENKRLRERQQEIEKERQINELSSLTRNGATNKEQKSGLDWMYNDEAATRETNQDFLLGKKRIQASLLNAQQSRSPQDSKNTSPSQNDIKPTRKTNVSKGNADLSRDDPFGAFQKAQQSRTVKKPNKIHKPAPNPSKRQTNDKRHVSPRKTFHNAPKDLDY